MRTMVVLDAPTALVVWVFGWALILSAPFIVGLIAIWTLAIGLDHIGVSFLLEWLMGVLGVTR